jgi:uncharacterized membrane protein
MSKQKKDFKPVNGENMPTEIPVEVATLLKGIPEDKQKLLIRALTVSISQHTGPLPNGETLTIYNQQIPNGGDRIMTTVERQLEHRITLESTGVRRSFNQSSTGQWMAFGIAIFFGLVAWDLAKSDKEVVAGIIGGIDIIGLVTVFIVGNYKKK